MRVIVLDGNENQAVAAARSLGRAGWNVVVGSPDRWSKAGWSRFCSRQFRYVAPQHDAERFVEDVAAMASAQAGTVVMPMTERSTIPLSARRHLLDAVGARYVFPDHDTLLRGMDKAAMTALASSLGIDVPLTVELSDEGEAMEFAADAPYPVVLKPRSSEEASSEGGSTRSTGKPLYADSPGQFAEAFRSLKRRAGVVLVQEYVEGGGAGYFALLRHGELRAEFAHRRLRDVRPTGSGSSLRESVSVDPRQRDAALAILKALRWHGVAMVEFRVRHEGTPVFLEVNGRFWNSLALPIQAGVDFPALLAQIAVYGDAATVATYRTGVRCRWLLGDARHLLAVIRGRPAGYQGRFPGRLSTLASFLTPVRDTFHDNFCRDDPLPELGDWLDFAIRRIPRAILGRWRGPAPTAKRFPSTAAPS